MTCRAHRDVIHSHHAVPQGTCLTLAPSCPISFFLYRREWLSHVRSMLAPHIRCSMKHILQTLHQSLQEMAILESHNFQFSSNSTSPLNSGWPQQLYCKFYHCSFLWVLLIITVLHKASTSYITRRFLVCGSEVTTSLHHLRWFRCSTWGGWVGGIQA